MAEATTPLDVEPIRARLAQVAPGPWWWGGHTDHGDVGLRARVPGLGWVDLLRTCAQEVTEEEAGAEYDRDADLRDYWTRDAYVEDRVERPRRVLAFLSSVSGQTHVELGVDRAVYEVARAQGLPDDTPRTHPKVYRDDVVAIRNPHAEFIAHSPEDVAALLAEVDRLRAEAAAPERERAARLANCPGRHVPTQHRDGLGPWCRRCGRDADGHPVRPVQSGADFVAGLRAASDAELRRTGVDLPEDHRG